LEQNVAAFEISKTLTKQEIADLEAAAPKHEVCSVHANQTSLAHNPWPTLGMARTPQRHKLQQRMVIAQIACIGTAQSSSTLQSVHTTSHLCCNR